MTLTFATLYSGGEGAGCGARAAGLRHLWGIEHDPAIAAVAQQNGFDVRVGDVTLCSPSDFEHPNILHASPPCVSFSSAKTNRKETDNDLIMADAINDFIFALRPDVFTLENVFGYHKSASFQGILSILHREGYDYWWWHLNSADYGVPQTRKRLILIAQLEGGIPTRPLSTHLDPTRTQKQTRLFDAMLPSWVTWYDSVKDLMPGLPESELVPWQVARLPEEYKTVLYGAGGFGGEIVKADRDRPAFTITANRNQATQLRAIIISEQTNARGRPRTDREPTKTVSAQPSGGLPRALLIGSENAGQEWDGMKNGSLPAMTITAQQRPRALLVSGAGAGDNKCVLRNSDETAPTVVASEVKRPTRAFLVGGQYGQPSGTPNRTVQCTEGTAFTVAASNKGDWKGVITGRVVQMTPRALARFQSFPDWYQLSGKKTLDCRVIGNAVPPLMYQRIIESLKIMKGRESEDNT